MELERDDLKGLAKFTKKGELQSKIDRKNEEIDLLKVGLSGIAKRYGYQNVQEFSRIYHKSDSAYITYREQEVEWEKIYGIKVQDDTIQEKIQNVQKKIYQQKEQIPRQKDRERR